MISDHWIQRGLAGLPIITVGVAGHSFGAKPGEQRHPLENHPELHSRLGIISRKD